jgi:hypothetical protein
MHGITAGDRKRRVIQNKPAQKLTVLFKRGQLYAAVSISEHCEVQRSNPWRGLRLLYVIWYQLNILRKAGNRTRWSSTCLTNRSVRTTRMLIPHVEVHSSSPRSFPVRPTLQQAPIVRRRFVPIERILVAWRVDRRRQAAASRSVKEDARFAVFSRDGPLRRPNGSDTRRRRSTLGSAPVVQFHRSSGSSARGPTPACRRRAKKRRRAREKLAGVDARDKRSRSIGTGSNRLPRARRAATPAPPPRTRHGDGLYQVRNAKNRSFLIRSFVRSFGWCACSEPSPYQLAAQTLVFRLPTAQVSKHKCGVVARQTVNGRQMRPAATPREINSPLVAYTCSERGHRTRRPEVRAFESAFSYHQLPSASAAYCFHHADYNATTRSLVSLIQGLDVLLTTRTLRCLCNRGYDCWRYCVECALRSAHIFVVVDN